MYRAVFLYLLVIVAVPIALLRPFGGLLIYLWVSFGRPGDFVWPDYTFDYSIWIAVATLLGYAIFEMHRSPVRLKGMWLLLLLWVWLGITSVTAQQPGLALPKLWEYTRTFGMAFLTAALANSEKRIRVILYVLAISLGLLGAKGAFDAITTGFASSMKGPGGMMYDENEYALALNMGIPILYWVAKDNPRKWVGVVFKLMAFASAILVVATRSRSGFLGLLVAAMVIAAFSKRKALLSAGAVIGVALLLLLGPQGSLDRYKTIPTHTDASSMDRIQVWKVALKMSAAHPLFGVGLRNFMAELPKYADSTPRVTHNAVLDLLSETGVPGAVLFVSLILAAIGEMFLLRLKASAHPEAHQLALFCQILLATFLIYWVPNMFINRQDFDLFYQLIAVEAGLVAVVRQRISGERSEAALTGESGTPLWARAAAAVPAVAGDAPRLEP